MYICIVHMKVNINNKVNVQVKKNNTYYDTEIKKI